MFKLSLRIDIDIGILTKLTFDSCILDPPLSEAPSPLLSIGTLKMISSSTMLEHNEYDSFISANRRSPF